MFIAGTLDCMGIVLVVGICVAAGIIGICGIVGALGRIIIIPRCAKT
jgi:hypothetical protein